MHITRKLAIAGLVLAIAASIAYFAGKKPVSTLKTAKPGRVLIIGIDGFTWHILDAALAQGRTPHVRRLIENGVSGDAVIGIDQDHLWSPTIWTSMLTGRHFSAHGIDNLYSIVEGRLLAFPISTLRRSDAIWNHLSSAGVPSAFISFLATWPAESIAGAMVSCFAIPWAYIESRKYLGRPAFFERFKNPQKLTSPPELMERVRAALPSDADITEGMRGLGLPLSFTAARGEQERIGFHKVTRHLKEKLLRDAGQSIDQSDFQVIDVLGGSGHLHKMMYAMDAVSTELGRQFLTEGKLPVVGVYLGSADLFEHFYWPTAEGDFVAPPELIASYAYIDLLIGRLLEVAPPDTQVFILSDHGYRFDSANKVTLHDAGRVVFIAQGPHLPKGRTGASVSILDFTPSLLQHAGVDVQAGVLDGEVSSTLFSPATP